MHRGQDLPTPPHARRLCQPLSLFIRALQLVVSSTMLAVESSCFSGCFRCKSRQIR